MIEDMLSILSHCSCVSTEAVMSIPGVCQIEHVQGWLMFAILSEL